MSKQKSTELSPTIAQHNNMINASFNMKEVETKLFIAGLRRIKKSDPEFTVSYIMKDEILPGVTGGKAYEIIRSSALNLADKKINVEQIGLVNGKRKFRVTPLMSECEYEEGSGVIKLKFNDAVRPYLLNLNRHFTIAEIKYLMQLKRPAAHRFYWLLKSNFFDKKEFEKDLETIKEMLGMSGKYPNYSDFDKYVLKPSWEEIQDTDIKYKYEAIKIGKGVKKIKFIKNAFIPEENPGMLLPGILMSYDLEKKLKEAGITSIDEINRLIYENKITEEYIEFCLNYKRKATRNLAGAIFKDITERYKLAEFDKKLKIKKAPGAPVKEPEQIIFTIAEVKDIFDYNMENKAAMKLGPEYSSWEEYLQIVYFNDGFIRKNIKGVDSLVKTTKG